MIPLRTKLYMWGYEPIQIGSTRKLHTCKNIVYSFWKWTHFPSVTQNEPLKSTLYLWTSYKSTSCFSPVWAILQINSSYSQSWVYSTVLPSLHTNVHQRDHFCAFIFYPTPVRIDYAYHRELESPPPTLSMNIQFCGSWKDKTSFFNNCVSPIFTIHNPTTIYVHLFLHFPAMA